MPGLMQNFYFTLPGSFSFMLVVEGFANLIILAFGIKPQIFFSDPNCASFLFEEIFHSCTVSLAVEVLYRFCVPHV